MQQYLTYTLLLISASAAAAVELGCPGDDIAEFMKSSLSPKCRESLTNLQYEGNREDKSVQFLPSTSDLDTVCQEDCAGIYTSWLRDACSDPYRARMVEAMCVFTAETTDIGPRCRYAFPDAIDSLNSYFSGVFNCGLGSPLGGCPDACREPMRELVDLLGCCYPSLYNNIDFSQYLENIGLINSTIASGLDFLGKVPEWQLCEVSVPPQCENIVFTPPTYQPVSVSVGSTPRCYFGMASLVMWAMLSLLAFVSF